MTRTEYEQHLAGLGSWAELLPPWEMTAEESNQSKAADEWDVSRATDEWFAERSRHRWTNWEKICARDIACTLLQLTDLSPSQVRERWPEEAEWLLEEESYRKESP